MSGIFNRFSETAKRFEDLPSLQMKGEDGLKSFTFRDISDRAVGIGHYLSSLGIIKGDRVAIFSENCPEWGMAYLGIVSTGVVAVPLDAQYTKVEAENLLKDSESRAIFTSKALLPIVEEASTALNIKIIRLDEPVPGNPPSPPFAKGGEVSESPFEKGGFRGILNDDIASLLYTSGTTGVPKGVMLTHGNLLSNADAIIESGIVAKDDHVLGILPLHHSYPFMVCFLVPILAGG
ncbi:MAG: acyl--CoA ligase [Deltaproteobacteria bacterium]|nr:acyl--CoA ligase [Deltaproteobacteria bacterium]